MSLTATKISKLSSSSFATNRRQPSHLPPIQPPPQPRQPAQPLRRNSHAAPSTSHHRRRTPAPGSRTELACLGAGLPLRLSLRGHRRSLGSVALRALDAPMKILPQIPEIYCPPPVLLCVPMPI